MADVWNKYEPTAARKRTKPGREIRPKSMTIDFHAHVAVPAASQYAAPHINPAADPLSFNTGDLDVKAKMYKNNGAVQLDTFAVSQSSTDDEQYPSIARADDECSRSLAFRKSEPLLDRSLVWGDLVLVLGEELDGRIETEPLVVARDEASSKRMDEAFIVGEA